MTMNLQLKICLLRMDLLLLLISIFNHLQQNYIKCVKIYLKKFWGNCLQEIIIAIICIQNMILLFRNLGLY